MKNEHRKGRSHLAGAQGDAINAILAAVGYNIRLLLTWLRLIFAPYPGSDPQRVKSMTTLRFKGL